MHTQKKLVEDLGETGMKFPKWWNRMSDKYQWESEQDFSWEKI